MNPVILLSFLLVQVQIISSDTQLLDDENFKLLPKIYEIDRPDLCVKENDQFCQLILKLSPENPENPSKFWKTIEQSKKFADHYRHDVLKYAVCVNSDDSRQNVTNLTESVSSIYTNKFQHLGLVANPTKIDCEIQDHRLFQPKLYDWIVLFSILAYFSLSIFATFCDSRKITGNRFLMVFSITGNFRKMLKNCNGDKLKCVQGIRFFTTFFIIASHTYLVLMISYVGNTEFFEEVPTIWWKNTARDMFSFTVGTFFVLSGWFLSYGALRLFKNHQNNKSPWKFVFLTFLNRCLRLLPVLAVLIVAIDTTWLTGLIRGPVKKIFLDGELKRCRKNWWMNFLFVNNFILADTCCLHTWYLAADTQLYLLSLIILAAIWKFNLNFVNTFLKLIFGAVLLHSITIYNEGVSDVILKGTADNYISLVLDQIYVKTFFTLYSSPLSRMASYFIGILFGYLYFQIEHGNIKLKINKVQKFFWDFCCLALPVTSFIICHYRYEKLTTSVLAALVQPIFALGIGLGILNLVTNSGGITAPIKAIFEWKPIVFLGNMSYSVYLMQITFLFFKVGTSTEVFQLSDWKAVKFFVGDIVGAHFAGFLTHLLAELPMGELQNLVVPKMRAKPSKKDL